MARRAQKTCRCPRYGFPHRWQRACDERAWDMGYQNAEDLVDAIKLAEGDPFLKLLEIAWHQQQERNSAKH